MCCPIQLEVPYYIKVIVCQQTGHLTSPFNDLKKVENGPESKNGAAFKFSSVVAGHVSVSQAFSCEECDPEHFNH